MLVLTGSYRALFTRVIYTEWIFFALLALGVVLLRRRPGYAPAWRMPLVPLAPIVFVIVSLMIVVNQIRADLTNSAIGLGDCRDPAFPAYYFWANRTSLAMKIDFHNHYYPPEYLAAVKKGPTKVRMDYDAEGNPRLHYPGDYNILVPGHRDLDYREGVLKKHGVDKQVITFTTPGTHFEEPATAVEMAKHINDAFATAVKRAQALPVAGDAAAERSGRLGHRARARDDDAGPAGRDGVQQRQRRGAGRRRSTSRCGRRPTSSAPSSTSIPRTRSASRRWSSTG